VVKVTVRTRDRDEKEKAGQLESVHDGKLMENRVYFFANHGANRRAVILRGYLLSWEKGKDEGPEEIRQLVLLITPSHEMVANLPCPVQKLVNDLSLVVRLR
jgi:hypothetical protein